MRDSAVRSSDFRAVKSLGVKGIRVDTAAGKGRVKEKEDLRVFKKFLAREEKLDI